MEQLKSILEQQLLSVIPSGTPLFFFDYPIHDNVGDLLIWKGAEEFFRSHRIKIMARFCDLNIPTLIHIPQDCLIVCHGGGNFGDLYPTHQKLREHLIANFPGHRIVILPQTIHFENSERLKQAQAIFDQHPDVHLFTRDQTSADIASRCFRSTHVYLAPDMAHALWPIRPHGSVDKDCLFLLRTDKETLAEQAGCPTANGCVKDWRDILSNSDYLLMKYFKSCHKRNKSLRNILPLAAIWRYYANRLIAKAIKEFSSYDQFVTSRLHGHLLACLMGKRNRLLDNSYGKNSAYYKTWTHRIDFVKFKSE